MVSATFLLDYKIKNNHIYCLASLVVLFNLDSM